MNELNITPDQKRALSIIFAVMIGLGSFYYFNSRPTEQVSQALIEIPAPVESITTQLIINVAGKVTNPGVYQLPQGSRVIDAIKAAGNQLRGVDISDINLARVLVDGEQILVGTKDGAPVALNLDFADEIINASAVTHGGQRRDPSAGGAK